MSGVKVSEILIFTLVGRLDVQTYQDVELKFQEWLNSGEKWFVGDFLHLDFISSIGLRVLLTTAKELNNRKGKMVLYGMNSAIKDVFDTTGLSSLITITSTKENALKEFQSI